MVNEVPLSLDYLFHFHIYTWPLSLPEASGEGHIPGDKFSEKIYLLVPSGSFKSLFSISLRLAISQAV